MERAYALWRAFQDRFLGRVAALLLIGCTLLAILEVVRRYVFGVSFEWQQDAVVFFILAGVFLYFGISQRHDAHLNVTVFMQGLELAGPRAFRVAQVLAFVARCVAFLFLLAVVWWGVPEVYENYGYGIRTESLAFPLAPFLLTLLIGFVFMAVSMFFQIYREYHKLRGRTVLVEPPEPAHMPD